MTELEVLCEKYGIKALAEYGKNRKPALDDFRDMHPYRVTLRNGRRTLTTDFFCGSAWTREPTAADVLACLCSDVSGVEHESFEGWAADRGYDADSRKAESIYRECEKLVPRLRRFLGERFEEVCSAEH